MISHFEMMYSKGAPDEDWSRRVDSKNLQESSAKQNISITLRQTNKKNKYGKV